MAFAFVLLSAFALGHPLAAAPPEVKVGMKRVEKLPTDFPGGSFADLSAYLYGGTRRHAKMLARLNRSLRAPLPAHPEIRYPLPAVRVQEGDSLEVIGAVWAGGSALSYKSLLRLNRRLKRRPDHIEPGQWVWLPRLPDPEERKRNLETFKSLNGLSEVPGTEGIAQAGAAKNEESAAPARAAESRSCPPASAASPFAPQSAAERLALVEWYSEHLDLKASSARFEQMLRELAADAPPGWKAQYLSGQYLLQSKRPAEALAHFEKGLLDPEAPIQVGLFFLKASEQSGKPADEARKKKLYERYPALESLQESSGSTQPTWVEDGR